MKELEDHNWFPAALRNYQTDFVGFASKLLGAYNPFYHYLRSQGVESGIVVDLCSGSGSPAVSMLEHYPVLARVHLTDKFPRQINFRDARITYHANSADVLRMRFNSEYCYTMFNSFHHFSDEDKVKIADRLKSAQCSARIVEILQPSLLCFLKVFLATIVGCLVLTPFIRPFSFGRLFFTYVVPINILTISFDGLVSVLKSRSDKFYRDLLCSDRHGIKVIRLGNCIRSVTVIEITPQHENAHRYMEVQPSAYDYREYDQHRFTLPHSLA